VLSGLLLESTIALGRMWEWAETRPQPALAARRIDGEEAR
jgi:hypothetical protein